MTHREALCVPKQDVSATRARRVGIALEHWADEYSVMNFPSNAQPDASIVMLVRF